VFFDSKLALGKRGEQRSVTALAVLTLTSMASTEEDPGVRLDDPIGPRLIRWSDGVWAMGKAVTLHRWFRQILERANPGAYGFMLARVRAIDDLIAEEVTAGLRQLVILGAGYDTRAHRMGVDLAGARVFEVDRPEMSRDKQKRVAQAVGDRAGNVSYVEVDFNGEAFPDRLGAHGFDPTQRTLFVLSGVSMYLPEGTVRDLFSQVAAATAGQASIVFDYFFDDLATDPDRYHGGRKWIESVKKAGEEFRCGISPSAVHALLGECGLRLSSQSDMAELARRYLVRSDGTSVARPYDFAALARAAVVAR
jgi:methyltransferase (TIGR00027 family)